MKTGFSWGEMGATKGSIRIFYYGFCKWKKNYSRSSFNLKFQDLRSSPEIKVLSSTSSKINLDNERAHNQQFPLKKILEKSMRLIRMSQIFR
jgi:hypothetical protein